MVPFSIAIKNLVADFSNIVSQLQFELQCLVVATHLIKFQSIDIGKHLALAS